MITAPHPLNDVRRTPLEQALIALLIGLLFSLATAALAFLAFQLFYLGRIYPGVSVAGVDVSGLTRAEAADRLTRSFTYPQTGRILLQDNERTWLIYPLQMGLLFDANTSAENAYAVGRTGNLFERLDEQWQAWQNGQSLPPVLILDGKTAYATLQDLATQIDQSPIEASLQIEGVQVIVRPGQTGRALDIPASFERIYAQLLTLQEGVVPLIVNTTSPAILDPSEQAQIAQRILSQPLTITLPEGETANAGPWVFDQVALASMLTIERVTLDGQNRFQVTLNSEVLRSFLEGLAPNLERTPENARFIFNDDTRQLERIQPAVIGRSLDVETSLKTLQEQIIIGQHTIPLVFDYHNPPVTDDKTAADLGITELIAVQTSYFRGSSRDRVQNIQTAGSRFHGLLVAPGETFSMAQTLGSISLDNGYAEAMIIVGGRTVKGVGGGVCQVSTTLFRTAFEAGFPIVERHAHAYRVYYYEQTANGYNARLAGLDATVFVPLVDFRFTNDTPYWLLMEVYVNPASSSITWKFYSTSDGRSVEWNTTGPINIVEPPPPLYRENPDLAKDEIKQVDWEAKGADVAVTRTVYRNGSIYFQDTVNTHYQPWRAIYEYGPGSEGIPTPEPEP
ncbi:MAG: VanW family protein [Longilinea sp.]|nr:VanW family protein [Longilinea sp.]